MKRYGYKELIECIRGGCYIRMNKMSHSTPGVPNISLMGTDDYANEILLGSVSFPTFSKLLDNHIIFRRNTEQSYDYFW